MATWLTHLRVADNVYRQFHGKNASLFFAGSIAPDTDMPPDITHWCKNGDKTTCDAERFFDTFISGHGECGDMDFYRGYYVHLLTDIMWHQQKIKPLKRENADVKKSVKNGWKQADSDFLLRQPAFMPVAMLAEKAGVKKKWFPYYEDDTVEVLMEQLLIRSKEPGDCHVDPDVKKEIDQFIKECSSRLITQCRHMF